MSDQHSKADTQASDDSSTVVVWHMIRKYWPTAVAAFVIVVLGSIFYTLGQKRIYQAQATVHFDPTPPRPLGRRVENVVDMGAGSMWAFQEYYETQYHIIQSRRVALEVVKELGLHHDQAFLQNLPPEGEPKENSGEVTAEHAADVLRGRLSVESIRDSRLAKVKLRDANPERAQRILTVLVETYIEQNLDRALASTGSATDWLRSQLDTLKNDLEDSELELHKYKKKNDILSVAFDDKSSMLAEEMSNINAELTRVKAKLQEAAARRAVLNSAPDGNPSMIQATELLNSSVLISLRSEYQRAIRHRDALLGANKGPNHPDVVSAQREIDATREAILEEIGNIKKAASRDVAALSRQAGGLQSMLDEAREEAHDLNLLEIEYKRLQRSKDNTEKLYSLVLERTKEADLSQMMRVNNISIIDRPVQPKSPVSPNIPLNVAIGALLGMALGLGGAFARGLLDRTIKVPEDIEDDLGVTFLGLLPQLSEKSTQTAYGSKRKRRRGRRVPTSGTPELIVHDEPRSAIAEASRGVRTNLMFMAADDPYRTLLVTSAGPSEGKTTVACCVAVAMAQAGQRVVLVDCDLRRPRLHRIFDVDNTTGMTTALLEGDLEEIIQGSAVPNLSVISSGPIPPNPAELLHTDRFKTLLAELSTKFDRVILDSPPVAAVTDPTILSTLVDASVIVVRAFKTRKDLARHSLRSVQDVGGRVAGSVLNAVDFSRMEYKYSYHYYRQDAYYGEQPVRSQGDGREEGESVHSQAAPPG